MYPLQGSRITQYRDLLNIVYDMEMRTEGRKGYLVKFYVKPVSSVKYV